MAPKRRAATGPPVAPISAIAARKRRQTAPLKQDAADEDHQNNNVAAEAEAADVEMADAPVAAAPAIVPVVAPIDFVFPTNHQCRSRGGAGNTGEEVLEISIADGDRVKFPVVGSYRLAVTKGSEVTVAGATLRMGDAVFVQAPLSYSVPIIRCAGEAVIRLEPYPNALGRLEKLSRLFRGLWLEGGSQPSAGLQPRFEGCRIAYPAETAKVPLQTLSLPAEWNKKIASVLETSRDRDFSVLVCGPKSSGKSTFSRILANKIQTCDSTNQQVVLLDLDPGQPEFVPPGTLSLVLLRRPNSSPPFTHPWPDDVSASLIRCHALGATWPSDSSLYLGIATNLYEVYQKSWRHLPLIINTPGWILGTGLYHLTTLIECLLPSEIIYMSEEGPQETVDDLHKACSEAERTLTTLPSQPAPAASRTALELRQMHTMSYFHYIQAPDGQFGWRDSPIWSLRPYAVAYEGPLKAISAIVCYRTEGGSKYLAEAVNGMVLAIVEIEDMRAFGTREEVGSSDTEGIPAYNDIEDLVAHSPEGIPHVFIEKLGTLDPRYSQMLGLAIVRGVDTLARARRLLLLSPVASERLNQVKEKGRHLVLVRGKLDTPDWAYTEEAYMGVDGDYGAMPWVEALEGDERKPTGSEALRVRRDLGRRTGQTGK